MEKPYDRLHTWQSHSPHTAILPRAVCNRCSSPLPSRRLRARPLLFPLLICPFLCPLCDSLCGHSASCDRDCHGGPGTIIVRQRGYAAVRVVRLRSAYALTNRRVGSGRDTLCIEHTHTSMPKLSWRRGMCARSAGRSQRLCPSRSRRKSGWRPDPLSPAFS